MSWAIWKFFKCNSGTPYTDIDVKFLSRSNREYLVMMILILTGKKRGFISLLISKFMKIMKPCFSLSVTEMSTLAIKFIP